LLPDLTTALLELGVVIAFALSAIFLKALDGRGFLASVAVGYSILLGGGWKWFIIVAIFFALGVGFTFYKYEFKKKIGTAQEKGGARDWPNILANGGAASLFAIGELVYGGQVFAALFLGSIATSASDTVATELGLLSKREPRLLTRPSTVVSPGTSGGVTPLGISGEVFASVVIGTMAIFLRVLASGFATLAIVAGGGILGASADSVLGASIQRKGYCVICGKPVEALTHCGERTHRTGGFPFVENNLVNLFASLVGAVSSLGFAVALLGY
jgi:uncharacterized protein (TIGR00297 family)